MTTKLRVVRICAAWFLFVSGSLQWLAGGGSGRVAHPFLDSCGLEASAGTTASFCSDEHERAVNYCGPINAVRQRADHLFEKFDERRRYSLLPAATRRVSLASESYLGEYKDLEIQRWLDGMLSARGFQNRVPLLLILSVTFGRGQFGSRPCNFDNRIVTQHTATNKNHVENFFSGTRNLIELDELIPMSPLSGSSST